MNTRLLQLPRSLSLSLSLSLILALTPASLLGQLNWSEREEKAIAQSTLAFAQKLSQQIVIIGRTGLTTTRVATVIDQEGHLLAPFIASIDGQDAPYLLYRPDGSRVQLTTVAEKPKRFLALLKLEEKDESLIPTRISKVVDHSVMIPTCAPIASLGETPSISVDHLEFAPPEKATAIRLDRSLYSPGSPVFDLSGSLIAVTLASRRTNTPALFITRVLEEFAELDALLPELSESALPKLPKAPKIEPNEAEKIRESSLNEARERYLQSTQQNPLPCVHIFNEGAPSTHSVIGTIVRKDGMILTKASDLGPDLRVRFRSKNYRGILLASDEASDLALVGIDATDLPVVRWSDELPAPGSTLAAPILLQESTEDMLTKPSARSGTFSHILKAHTPTVHATSQVTSLGLVTEQTEDGITIAAIQKDSPAYESGLSPGDLIEKIDGQKITQRSELTRILNSHRVGDELSVVTTSPNGPQEYSVTLISPRLIPPATGIIVPRVSMIPSVRRAPFPDVMVHSIPLNSWDCGSPLFDSQGRALGLNIAAASPNRSLALRPATLRKVLEKLLRKTRAF